MARPGARGQVGESLTGSAARERAVLVDGPWAPRWYWRDELEAMQQAGRRSPQSAVLRRYRSTTKFRPIPLTRRPPPSRAPTPTGSTTQPERGWRMAAAQFLEDRTHPACVCATQQ